MTNGQQETLFDMPGSEPEEPDESSLEKRTSLDRLEMVYGELGFIPHSRDELNYATLALDNRDTTGGFARLLNEVLLHQKKADTEDASAALRSIVARVKGYAETTRGDKMTLGEIEEELQGFLGIQNFLELEAIPNLSPWSLQPTTTRGLGLINRHLVVKKAINDQEMPALDHLTEEEAIAEMMAETRIYEASQAIKDSLTEADRRHEFWVGCIKEATRHTSVRPLAFQALRNLGIKTE